MADTTEIIEAEKPKVEAVDTTHRGHHPDSPSSIQASEDCPLFENEQRNSQASIDGTLQHTAAETRDLTILEGNEAWIKAVSECIEYEDAIIQWHRDTFGGEPKVVKEQYVAVGDDIVVAKDGTVYKGITGGFPDVLIVSPDETFIDVPDWKFGKVPVTPTKGNRQGQSYGTAAAQIFPKAQFVRVHFKAPHQGFSDEEHQEKYVHTFTRAELPGIELALRTIIARKHEAKKALAEKGDWSAATPRNDLCVWCALKGRCVKNLKLVLNAHSKHELATIPPVFSAVEISTPEQLAHAYKAVNHLEPILKAIKAHCTTLALTRDDMLPADWKIVRRQDREITDLKALIEAAKRHGVKKADLEALYTLPISKIEAAVKSKAEKGMGAAAVRGFAATLEELGAVKLGPPVHFLQQVKTPAEKSRVDPSTLEAPINI
jgi:hypothetical protein